MQRSHTMYCLSAPSVMVSGSVPGTAPGVHVFIRAACSMSRQNCAPPNSIVHAPSAVPLVFFEPRLRRFEPIAVELLASFDSLKPSEVNGTYFRVVGGVSVPS